MKITKTWHSHVNFRSDCYPSNGLCRSC